MQSTARGYVLLCFVKCVQQCNHAQFNSQLHFQHLAIFTSDHLFAFQVLFTNVVSWILLLSVSRSRILPAEALPVGALPKGGRWEASGSEDDSEVEQSYVTEGEVYKRLTSSRLDRNIHKKSAAYVRRGKLFNRNGYVLRMNLDGTVDGTTDKHSPLGKVFLIFD